MSTPTSTRTTTTTTTVKGHYWERRRRSPLIPVLVGAVGLAALGTAFEWPLRHRLEDDLTTRSTTALTALGLPGDDKLSVSFTGRDATLTGSALTQQDVDAALAAVRRVDGVRVAVARVNLPGSPSSSPAPAGPAAPQLTAVVKDAAVTLTGRVPTTDAKASLVAAAAATYGADHVVDQLTVDPGVSAIGLTGFGSLFAALGTKADATADLTDGTLTLTGNVPDETSMKAAASAGQSIVATPDRLHVSLTPGGTATAPPPASSGSPASTPSLMPPTATTAPPSTTVPAPSPSQSVQAQLINLPVVTFQYDTDVLDAPGVAVVKQAADILKAHPSTKVRIEGNTDDRGDWDHNRALSLARANRVMATLAALGVNTSGFTTIGYGEDHPKVPNDSDAHRAQNRRVDLVVLT